MLQSVYNYLIPEIMAKPIPVFGNTHKKNELRFLYNYILSSNKCSPLYKVSLSNENQVYAISLKESSMALSSILSVLSRTEDTPFDLKKPASQRPDKILPTFVSEDYSSLPEPFTIELKSLAKPQVNVSRTIPREGVRPKSGSYSFVIHTEENHYELQFNIKSTSSNEEILNKLAKFMNRSNLGVTASVQEIDKNNIAFSITSKDTGNIGEPLFTLEDTKAPSGQIGLVQFYELNRIETPSSNAHFLLSGEENEALTNHLVLNHSLQLDFYEVCDEPVEISYLPDAPNIITHIRKFVSTYNEMTELIQTYPSSQGHSAKLIRQLKQSLSPFEHELEACGLSFTKKNTLKLDDSLARQAIEEGDMQRLFSSEFGMTRSLLAKAASVTINPMDYVDKKLIIYPNYSKIGIPHPYCATMYSGMLFNYYC